MRASRERVETAIALEQRVVLQFEKGDGAKPIIMGFIERLEEASPQPWQRPLRWAKPTSTASGSA